ncbi:hypothetical protein U0070_013560 [Myodes glareolus]|uniref:F-box/WD repeat-containing protein 4 n=1 Tax=Myodes glareolus TaxID=447135 RepID=A0AAW0I976_MYOGA
MDEGVGIREPLEEDMGRSCQRHAILCEVLSSQMPWMQLEDASLYISQANFILAYQFRPDGASLNRQPFRVFAGHDEDVCHFVLANSHIISAGGDGKIGVHKLHSTFTVKYSAHEQEVNCVDCKGGIIVSGSRDRTAKVWPLASGQLGQCLHTIQTEDRVWSIAISPLLSSVVINDFKFISVTLLHHHSWELDDDFKQSLTRTCI